MATLSDCYELVKSMFSILIDTKYEFCNLNRNFKEVISITTNKPSEKGAVVSRMQPLENFTAYEESVKSSVK